MDEFYPPASGRLVSLQQHKHTLTCHACVAMQTTVLLQIASEGGFWSYACGVAVEVLTYYQIDTGIVIDNYRTDLPVRKGLSSSAALCVLVARAFNRLFDLKWTTAGEMDIAYRGEINTPSRWYVCACRHSTRCSLIGTTPATPNESGLI
jgi:galactokinase